MDNKMWEHTGKGQYELKDIPYAGYSDGPLKSEKKGKSALSFITGFIAGISLVLIIYFGIFRFSNSLSMETQKKIGVLESTIDRYFMGEREAATEADGIYKGIVSSLGDKYAQYYTNEELTRSREDSAGEFSGIGCTIALDEEYGVCYIASVMEGYSAEQAGIQEGDFFIEVDGEDATGWTAAEVASHVKGETGTTVELTMLRDSEELHFTVERVKVESKTVDSRMEDEEKKIGYIRIAEFDSITVSQFQEAKETLEKEGMKALILDLRSNPGGLVDSCADIASQMLPKGIIAYSETKDGRRFEWKSDGKHEIDIPVVILVNQNTASAAEILTGAMKDYKKATVLGIKTYGKGIIQNTYSLGDGTAVEFTVGQYYLPNDETIHEKGIEPDIKVELDTEAYLKDGTDNQLEAALKELGK
ncbi:MAG: S41 family peptidase [Lachnospiraceae bacterium]|nr:S41 family peptidase [Lachnospiraceae bacterium]